MQGYALFLTKNRLGYFLVDFFTNSSGHPDGRQSYNRVFNTSAVHTYIHTYIPSTSSASFQTIFVLDFPQIHSYIAHVLKHNQQKQKQQQQQQQ
jgi:hypothetical protein